MVVVFVVVVVIECRWGVAAQKKSDVRGVEMTRRE